MTAPPERGDDNRLDVLCGDQLLAGHISFGADAGCNLLGLLRVGVAYGDDTRARQNGSETADMVLADHADADHADL